MYILLAEDDYNVALIMRLCLEKMGGHSVIIADDGEKAVNVALTTEVPKFDLILLDGMMPKKPGLQVAKELREAGCETPIIFLSAKTDEKDYLTYGCGFIPKPFEPTTICDLITEILHSHAGNE